MNDWLSKMYIGWLLIDVMYDYQAEVQNIYDVFCANTNVTVLWVYLYDNTYFLRNTTSRVFANVYYGYGASRLLLERPAAVWIGLKGFAHRVYGPT